MWKIPRLEKGDKIRLLQDIPIKSGTIILKEGSEFTVTDVGVRYRLPFISPEGITHEIQLQPKTYEKVA